MEAQANQWLHPGRQDSSDLISQCFSSSSLGGLPRRQWGDEKIVPTVINGLVASSYIWGRKGCTRLGLPVNKPSKKGFTFLFISWEIQAIPVSPYKIAGFTVKSVLWRSSCGFSNNATGTTSRYVEAVSGCISVSQGCSWLRVMVATL